MCLKQEKKAVEYFCNNGDTEGREFVMIEALQPGPGGAITNPTDT